LFRDEDTLESLGLNTGAMLYFKDRGLQIGWTTVFLTEYAGPLFVYLWFYRYDMLYVKDVNSQGRRLSISRSEKLFFLY
jgi:hypothetical protein